ncbi:MAG: hypothetical protein SH847_25845 [Roseiflexaceae bacterium]|nr:hypothetical protein [Roseiflexaceae bacterium]
MDMQAALVALGVREDTLTNEEKDALDRDGFLPISMIRSIQ